MNKNYQTCGHLPGSWLRAPKPLRQLRACARTADKLFVQTSYAAGRWFWSLTSYADNSQEVREWALRAVGLGVPESPQASDAVDPVVGGSNG